MNPSLRQLFSQSKKCTRLLHNASNVSVEEVRIPVPWGHIASKWWGPKNQRPILTFHGWQDNCGSFNRLIPLLNQNVGFLTIDLPGHGLSSHYPTGLYPDLFNYIALIEFIANYFKWPKVSLMGHSFGGLTCYNYTNMYPDYVDFLIGIDTMIFLRSFDQIAGNLKKFMQVHEYHTSDEEPPSYSLDEIRRRVHAPNDKSIESAHAHHIFERNIAPSKKHPNKYYFTLDPRLKLAHMHVDQEELVRNAKRITCPVFFAKSAFYYEPKEKFYQVLDVLKQTSKDCDFHSLEGKHHMHLNHPEELAKLINKFIDRHNVEDRSIDKNIKLDALCKY